MSTFSAYATNFEVYPNEGVAFQHLFPLLRGLERVNFLFRIEDPTVNQGQMVSDFDEELEKILVAHGAKSIVFRLPLDIPQKLDFAFTFKRRSVVVEIEKTNREKILRDILKCHMYLRAGADFAIVGLPKNYPHKHGVWNLFDFGVDRFTECRTYGFGTEDKLGRILLLGFEQYASATDQLLCKATRHDMRTQALNRLS
jgi:hypothetical protein